MYLNDLVPPSSVNDYLPSSSDRVTKVGSNNDLAPFIDVFILGPAMVYGGLGKELPAPLKAMLLVTGVGVIVSNFDKLNV